jgi:Ca-activated chloride channel family protein
LLAAAVVPVLALLLHGWSERRAQKRLRSLISPRLKEQLLRSVDFGKRWHKAIVLACGLAVLLVAVARPQFGFKPMEVERSSVDFIVALDLSRSMLAEDVETKPRMEAAKEGLNALLDRIGSDRAGLIAFAGDAFLAAPVTQDHEAVKRNLAALTTDSIAKQGSDMAKAIELAVKTFENGKYETKALVIVTDGEELQGDAIVAARAASQKGLSIFTVGVGTSIGARIPTKKDGSGMARFSKNEFGNEVVTRLNERMLQQLAASGANTKLANTRPYRVVATAMPLAPAKLLVVATVDDRRPSATSVPTRPHTGESSAALTSTMTARCEASMRSS